MRDEFSNHTREQLLEELEAAQLRLAFYDKQAQENEAIEDDYQADDALRQRVEQMQPEALNLISHHIAQKKRRFFKERVAPVAWKVAKVAACILLIGYIGLSTTMAFSQAARLHIMGLIVRTEDHLTHIGLANDWESIEVPDKWDGEYYPAYVPDGFTLHSVDSFMGVTACVEYASPDHRWYQFTESTENAVSSVSTKNALMTEITIHDRPALLIEAPDVTMVVWAEYDKWFSVTTWSDMDVVQIARSVTRIR